MPAATEVGRKDLERAIHLLDRGEGFVCKLHGSISDIRSTVFTSQDYDQLLADSRYLDLLERLHSRTSLIFVGYSLQDDHVLSLLQRNQDLAELFGDGPHFAILPDQPTSLPSSVRVIRYAPEPHRDHRSSIAVIEEIRSLCHHQIEIPPPLQEESTKQSEIHSAHLLFHIFPPGIWSTSETIEVTDSAGVAKQLIVGTGFSDAELPDNRSTAMHDVIVGLLCFDQVLAPLQALGRIHDLIGGDRFWALVRDDILAFVDWPHQEGIFFPGPDSVASGELTSLEAYNPDFTRYSVGQAIRRQLKPAPGKDDVAEKLFAELEAKTRQIPPLEEGNIPDLVRGLLLRPSIRELLGISGGTPLNSLTRWQVFPVLRLASVVKIGAACRVLGIGSAKLDFGTSKLAGPAFASAAGREWTDDTASYVVCGRFSADIGQLVIQDPSILDAVLSFRHTQTGESLRREVLGRLAANEGAEVNVAVNSALEAGIPVRTLQQAHDQFVSLLVSELPNVPLCTAIWNDKRYAEDAISRWHQASKRILEKHCTRLGISPYDPCPCGSGEKLKFCCEEALQR